MTDDAGAKLLTAVEALMAEVVGLRQDMSRDRHATAELTRLRKAASERKAKSREGLKSQDSHATESRDGHVTPQVVKAVDLDQERKEKSNRSAGRVTVTPIGHVTPHPKPPTGPVWIAYSTAYEARYQAKPVRNAKVNGQLAQLVKRLGENAAEVSAFYVGHSGAYYGQRGHCIDALLRDAEKLHMEWETGRQLTATEARQREKTRANAEGWNSLLKEPNNGLG